MIRFEKFTKGIGGKSVFCVGLVLELLCEKLNLIFDILGCLEHWVFRDFSPETLNF